MLKEAWLEIAVSGGQGGHPREISGGVIPKSDEKVR
jgi:hypothetical protein